MPGNTSLENVSLENSKKEAASYSLKVNGGQWTLEIIETEPGSDVFDYEIVNYDPVTGKRRFFSASNSGPFGQLVIDPEPDLGMSMDKLGFDYNLTGCILINPDGTVYDRFSLTKKTLIQKVEVEFNQETRELYFDGEPTGFYLVLLVIKDKNRIKGSDGYFVRERPEKEVMELELESLANSVLKEMGILK